MNSMFAVSVTFTAQPSKIEQLRHLLTEHAARTLRNEAGCRRFDIGTNADRPDEVFLYELYEDEAAFRVHSDAPYLADFFDEAKDLIASKQASRWNIVS